MVFAADLRVGEADVLQREPCLSTGSFREGERDAAAFAREV
jgi:hypothetical protein